MSVRHKKISHTSARVLLAPKVLVLKLLFCFCQAQGQGQGQRQKSNVKTNGLIHHHPPLNFFELKTAN